MKAYIVGNGKSVLDWEPKRPMYATNKYPLWLSPDVYMLTSKHCMKNWREDCQTRARRGRVLVWNAFAEYFPGREPIKVNHKAMWYDNGVYGIGGGSYFPLMQQALLDGATELVLVGIDGFKGDTCADDNHYDKDYFEGCMRKPGSERTNEHLMNGHTEAAKRCKEAGVRVSVLGNSMFASCYEEK